MDDIVIHIPYIPRETCQIDDNVILTWTGWINRNYHPHRPLRITDFEYYQDAAYVIRYINIPADVAQFRAFKAFKDCETLYDVGLVFNTKLPLIPMPGIDARACVRNAPALWLEEIDQPNDPTRGEYFAIITATFGTPIAWVWAKNGEVIKSWRSRRPVYRSIWNSDLVQRAFGSFQTGRSFYRVVGPIEW